MKPSLLLTIPFSIGLSLIVGGCAPQASLPGDLSSSAPSIADEAAVEIYLNENIGSLSPKSPTLGGMFYVTDVEFLGNNQARVAYEDGHMAYTGIATYAVENNMVSITSFDVAEDASESSSQASL